MNSILHAPAGRILRIVEAARQRDPLGGRQLVQDFVLLLLRQVFEDGDCIVGIEIAHAFGDGFGRQFVEDFLADRIVDFGERREVEVRAHQLDQPRSQLRVERLDQIADIGLVQVADELTQQRRVGRANRLRHALDIILPQRSLVRAQRIRCRRDGHVFFVEHAGAVPHNERSGSICACTLGSPHWQ